MHTLAREIVATIRQPLLLLDEHARVRDANPAFYRQFGLDPSATLGHSIFAIDAGRWDVPAFRALVATVHAGSTCEDFELRAERSGSTRVIVIDARRVRDDEGRVVALLCLDDVTDRMQVQEARQRLHQELEVRVRARTAELEAANKELEAFAYSVSHDLRAPLRAIDGFSSQLLEHYAAGLDDRGQHYLRRVRAGTQQMGQLIDDLLQLSRVGRVTMLDTPIDLSDVAATVVDELRGLEPERRVGVEIQPGLRAGGEPGLIKIVLHNLVGNAWKFTSATAAATIAVGRDAKSGAFFVRDNGAGFDMSHADKLFGAFQRLHPQRQFPGNGIGLALVQRIIHRHGGRVWAEGAPGRGATFFFTLPPMESP